ncbi:MAG: DoxX family protein [Candidatus Omnitrophica bacterium CG11_big_fil_rev_8_21_14_0_20_43_6]|nr:MAG: DoxX family protein [Candidatus Omnitrophica bacterium CG11_big_fil_rev_8_21_14_0_20_43_6]
MPDWGILVLRLGIGIMFAAHGLQKAFGFFGGPGIANFAQTLSGLGFIPGIFWAYVVAYAELLGGVSLIIGLFTRSASGMLLVLITTAAIKVHLAKGFFLSGGGFEYTFVIAAACLALILLGSGKFNIFKLM